MAKHSSNGIGPPPERLTAERAAIWREIANLLPMGVAEAGDTIGFELLVALTAESRRGALNAAALSQYRQLLDSYALTPLGRKHFGLGPQPPWAAAMTW